jgi:mRNA-degrading endonuclease toxin of MazEF toxin-antitoxin module
MQDWEPWLLAALAAALAGVLVAGIRRHRRAGWAGGPDRGDIWWADVPYADGSGSKVRPCLVMLRHRRGIVVLKITSQDKSRRGDHVPIPTRDWDPWARHDSYLNLGEPIVVPPAAFQRRAGVCDADVLCRIGGRAGLQPRDLRRLANRSR